MTVALVSLCASLSAPPRLAAQGDELPAYRIPGEDPDPVRLDGLLSEPMWMQAPLLTGFRQQEPFEGDEATERTEVRIAYDDETLYVGVTAYENRGDDVRVWNLRDRGLVMKVTYLMRM